ncbi:MAG: hypothetical protein K8R21_12210 [Leptospira sp.]|nr:hypothetical protein [Leptospira sp.]
MISFSSGVNSQDQLYDVYDKIERIKLKDIDQLLQLAADAEIVPMVKERAINRIGVLLNENPAEAEKQQNVITAMSNAITQNTTDSPAKPTYKVRSAACICLRVFDRTPMAVSAIEIVRKTMMEDKSLDVVSACAHSLGDFSLNSAPATKAILERLNRDYSKENRSSEDIRVISIIINSLGRLGSKQAFIPLMKVIQSGFPVSIKKEAQIAIDKLKW